MIEVRKDKKSLCLIDTTHDRMSTICGYGFNTLLEGLEDKSYGWFDFKEHFEDKVFQWKLISSYNDYVELKDNFKNDFPEYLI